MWDVIKRATEKLVARCVNCDGIHVDEQWIGGESNLACSFWG